MLRPFAHPVACCCAKFETSQTFQPKTPNISLVPWSPKGSATMLDPFAQLLQLFGWAAHAHYTWSLWRQQRNDFSWLYAKINYSFVNIQIRLRMAFWIPTKEYLKGSHFCIESIQSTQHHSRVHVCHSTFDWILLFYQYYDGARRTSSRGWTRNNNTT